MVEYVIPAILAHVQVYIVEHVVKVRQSKNIQLAFLKCLCRIACYYGNDQVSLVGGGSKSIKDLKSGDKVYSISEDGKDLIEDEIVLMMHNEPFKEALFYTFITDQGFKLSLTGRHNIHIYDPIEKQIKTIQSSQVKITDKLIVHGKYLDIRNIEMNTLQGFFSPLTLTGNLVVNNISTCVFSDRFDSNSNCSKILRIFSVCIFSYKVSPGTVQFVFFPIRIYYRLTKYLLGENYDPFEEREQGIHPIAQFYKDNQAILRVLVKSPFYVVFTIFFVLFVHFIYWRKSN